MHDEQIVLHVVTTYDFGVLLVIRNHHVASEMAIEARISVPEELTLVKRRRVHGYPKIPLQRRVKHIHQLIKVPAFRFLEHVLVVIYRFLN